MIKHLCDICEKEIKECDRIYEITIKDRPNITIKTPDYSYTSTSVSVAALLSETSKTYELCKSCYDRVARELGWS